MTDSTLNFQATQEDALRLRGVAQRVATIVRDYGVHPDPDYFGWWMDWTCVHCNGRPLDLRFALHCEPTLLIEDAISIKTNLDRRSGKLPVFVRLHCDVKAGIIR